jgi:SulP family sulfate permease
LPLALAFGVASGLGATAGLYGAIACGIFAALFGGTRGQVSGPTGPMTVVTASLLLSAGGVASGAAPIVFAAVILAGGLQILLGVFRLGQLIHYIPYPVISGFMTGIGVIIIILQIPVMFGLEGKGGVIDILGVSGHPIKFNIAAATLGVSTLIMIVLLKG